MKRRHLLASLSVLAAPRLAHAQGPVQITDIMGRQVTLPRPARRLVLAQARHVLALALLHPDPVSLVAGWGDDLRQMNPPDYAAVRARFPRADAVPLIGRTQGEGISLEAIVAAQPDAILLSGGGLRRAGDGLPDRLAALGIPTVVVDFYTDPMHDTRRSMAILGQLLGLEARAAAFDAFYAARITRIAARLAGLEEAQRPPVLIHAHAGGIPCCGSPGKGAFDSMIRFAGGHNIGADLLPGTTGQLPLEYVLSRDPSVYVATGGPFGGRGGISLGAGVDPALAARELAAVLRRERLDSLAAVKAGRAHAIWQGFNDTPAHIVMLEALARWFHPERCADLDPAATIAELNSQFLAIPMEGAHWVDLPPGVIR